MARITCCDKCKRPIEGQPASYDLTIQSEWGPLRVTLEGAERPDVCRACIIEAIAGTRTEADVIPMRTAK